MIRPRMFVVVVACTSGTVAIARVASADVPPPITNRDYAIDLHQGIVIGSTEIIGQGGAGVASTEGSIGALFNPAAAAVCPTAETKPFRLGMVDAVPVSRGEVETEACDPSDCAGYILPTNVELPATARFGGTYRFGPTAWNQRIPGKYRDERQYTVMADVSFAGRAWRRAGRLSRSLAATLWPAHQVKYKGWGEC